VTVLHSVAYTLDTLCLFWKFLHSFSESIFSSLVSSQFPSYFPKNNFNKLNFTKALTETSYIRYSWEFFENFHKSISWK